VGIGALFAGAVLGAVLGVRLGPRFGGPAGARGPGAPGAEGAAGADGATSADAATPEGPAAARPQPADAGSALVRALGELTGEVHQLREELRTRPAGRSPVDGGSEEQDRLVHLLDVLTSNLETATRTGTGPGYHGSPLLLPTGEALRNRLADEADLSEQERSRNNRFLTYQQVLDRYGPPDQVSDAGIWIYKDPLTGVELNFHFKDGLVTNVY